MKKLLSFLMIIALVTMCSFAYADSFYFETFGVTIDLPDGLTGMDESNEDTDMLVIKVDNDPSLIFVYAITYIEELDGKYLEDLSTEEARELGAAIGNAIENPTVDMAEIDGEPVVVIASGDGTQLHYLMLIDGCLFDVSVWRGDGVALGDDEVEACAELLLSAWFDED